MMNGIICEIVIYLVNANLSDAKVVGKIENSDTSKKKSLKMKEKVFVDY